MNVTRAASVGLSALAALAFSASAAEAQNRGTIYPGRTVSGVLDANDVRRGGNRYHEDWEFSGRRGETITVRLDATFDAYVEVYQGDAANSTRIASDDDSGDGLDAAVTVTLSADGPYWICVTLPENNAGTGSYTLSLASSYSSAPAVSNSGGTGGGWMSPGRSYSGSLSSSDSLWTDNTYYDIWRFSGEAGERISLRMQSPSFRSYIQLGRIVNGQFSYVSGSSGQTSGSQQYAVLETTLGSSGEYAIRANSHGTRATGPYTVAFTSSRSTYSPPPTVSSSPPAGSRVIMANETVSGDLSSSDATLPDGSYYDLWRYAGPTNQRIRITMRSSDFDAFLAFGTIENGVFSSIATNDDGTGGTDAMIDITITRGGEFVIRANSLSAGRTGRYSLHLQTW